MAVPHRLAGMSERLGFQVAFQHPEQTIELRRVCSLEITKRK